MKLILGSLSLLLLIAAAIVGFSSASTSVTQTTIGSGISCTSSCVNGVCENTCSDGGDVKVGNGDIIEKELDIKGFDEITVNSIDVVATQSSHYSITIMVDSNLVEDVVINKRGETLSIERKSGAYQGETINVKVTVPSLAKFSNFGAQASKVSNFKQSKISLINEGAGSITLVDSRIGKLAYDGHGSTTFSSDNSEVDSAKLEVSGASEVQLSFSDQAGNLTGSVEGVSSVYYCGSPSVNIEQSGIVDIEQQCD